MAREVREVLEVDTTVQQTEVRFFHGPGDDVTNISLTVEALNSGSTTLATSNTLTGMVISEDG
jgi:hypothetical protein